MKIETMRITATSNDECITHTGAFDSFCKLMGWELFAPTKASFTHNGWTVFIDHQISENVWLPMHKPWKFATRARMVKMEQGYTPTLRPYNKTCSKCSLCDGRKCTLGRFNVKSNGGCNQFTPKI